MIKSYLSIFTIIIATSCSFTNNQNNIDLKTIPSGLDNAKKANIKEFYDGDIKAFSIKFDQNDKIIASKSIEINSSWDENKGIVRQKFIDNNNNKDSRTWLVTLNDDNNFTAIGHDSVSPAQGIQNGNVIQMKYQLKIPFNGVKTKISFIDTMYVVNDESMIRISESYIKNKKIGKEIISLTKQQ